MKRTLAVVILLIIGWALTIAARLAVSAIIALSVLSAAWIIGTVLGIEIPYKAITAWTAIAVFVMLTARDVARF